MGKRDFYGFYNSYDLIQKVNKWENDNYFNFPKFAEMREALKMRMSTLDFVIRSNTSLVKQNSANVLIYDFYYYCKFIVSKDKSEKDYIYKLNKYYYNEQYERKYYKKLRNELFTCLNKLDIMVNNKLNDKNDDVVKLFGYILDKGE